MNMNDDPIPVIPLERAISDYLAISRNSEAFVSFESLEQRAWDRLWAAAKKANKVPQEA